MLDLVSLDVGIDVHLGKLEVTVEGVEAQAMLKVASITWRRSSTA